MANTRFGSDLLQLKPDSYRVPAPLKAGATIGGNTLVGIRADSGEAEQLDSPAAEAGGYTYRKVLVSLDELDEANPDNGVQITQGEIVNDVILVCEGSGFAAADLFKTVYGVDSKTVSLTKTVDSNGDTVTFDRPVAGTITEVISSTRVRVHIR